MVWNRTNTIGLAKVSCAYCEGMGVRIVHKKREVACNCVFRSVFRTCLNRFRDCVQRGPYAAKVSLEFCRGRDGRRSFARKSEEYMADFCLIAKRVLSEEEHRTFRIHFLLGADWRLCCRQMGLDRGNFFHAVYRIEQKLGRAFAETEPYALYPLDEYFAGAIRRAPVGRLQIPFRSELPLSA